MHPRKGKFPNSYRYIGHQSYDPCLSPYSKLSVNN